MKMDRTFGEKHPAMVALKTGEMVKDIIMGVFDPKNEQTRWINVNATPQLGKDDKNHFKYTPHLKILQNAKKLKKL